ncbi:carbohydrate ABC transporter permease [Actinotalea caeni]|uniref:carbohydrate ABC transporter permease n=1 Tax=Actinotalea caeni TaxID=1348467 RepID=UPI0030841539
MVPYLFVLAPIVLLVTFTYVPVANMFFYSVTDWDGLDRVKNFVGLANYVDVFTEPDNLRVFVVSLYYLGASFVQMALALYFATILSFRVRLKNLWKGILFFPYLINGVAIGLIFLNFIRPGGGLDSALLAVGLESVIRQWTGDPEVINYTLAAVSVWRYMGLNFVMFLGAIASVPGEIYEAAELDGANRWHQFRHLILPAIKPIVGLSFILAISGSLSVFEVPYIMTNGGNGSETFVIRTIKMAFENNKVGLASAMAVVLLAIVLVVTWIQRRLVPEERVDLT